MAEEQDTFLKIKEFDLSTIGQISDGQLDGRDFDMIRQLQEKLLTIRDLNYLEDSAAWHIYSLHNAADYFYTEIILRINSLDQRDVAKVFQTLMYGNETANNHKIFYTLPFLENYARTRKIEDTFTKEVDTALEQKIKSISQAEERLNTIIRKGDDTLRLLDLQAGKIGVKEYASIFSEQALEHSRVAKHMEGERWYYVFKIAKAQQWLIIAFVFMGFLGLSFSKLDTLFPLEGTVYTPLITVHLFGRIITISFIVFLISFSLKQFRINMHLYTLNKHRANTLKSFEYLTKAPDQLDPASYNAVVMKVAEAIYEAGQTGYISPAESHGDVPSIIDISKNIFPNGTRS